MAVQIEQRSFASIWREPSTDTMSRGSPFEFTASSVTQAAATDPATIVSAALDSANIHAYLGNWVQALDGSVAGELVRVREFDPPNDKITTDPFSATSPTTTKFRMWVPPEPVVVASDADGTTTTVDAALRIEVNDYWNDPDRYYLVTEGVGGAGTVTRGEARLVTDFDGTTNDRFTVSSVYSAAITQGDLLLLRQPIKFASAELELPEAGYQPIIRKFVRTDMEIDPLVQGPRSGSMRASLEWKGVSAISNGTTLAVAPTEAHDLLQSCLTFDADGSAAATGGSVSAPTVAVGEATRFGVGNVVVINGEAAGITSKDHVDNGPINISPSLSRAPANGDVIYGGCNYKPIETGFTSIGAEFYLDGGSTGVRRTVYGWHPSVSLEGLTAESIPMLAFEGPIDMHITQDVPAAWTPTFDTKVPVAAHASRFVLGGTTYSNVLEATFNSGYEFQPQTSFVGVAAGKNGHICTNRNPSGSFRVWMENANLIESFEQAKERELLIQVGSVPGSITVLWCPAIQFTAMNIAKESGGFVLEAEYQVIRSNIASVDCFVLAKV